MLPKCYRIYGISIESEIPFDHWPLVPTPPLTSKADVTIQFGCISSEWNSRLPADGWFYAEPGTVFLAIKDVGRFLVRNGQCVTFEPLGENSSEAWAYVEGAITGAILHQRNIWPLHGCAVARPDGTAAGFVGPRGIGKSTLLYELHRRGLPVLTDDIIAVRLDEEGRCWSYPGFPQGKLCMDAAERFGLPVCDLRSVGHPEKRKVAVPYSKQFSNLSHLLTDVYVLEEAGVARIESTELLGVEKLRQLSDHTYRLEFLSTGKEFQQLFETLIRASVHIKLTALRRPANENTVHELGSFISREWKLES